jgi:hypothetical protein
MSRYVPSLRAHCTTALCYMLQEGVYGEWSSTVCIHVPVHVQLPNSSDNVDSSGAAARARSPLCKQKRNSVHDHTSDESQQQQQQQLRQQLLQQFAELLSRVSIPDTLYDSD